MITIVTGCRGIGKTSFLLNLIKNLKTRDDNISGILTPPVYNQNKEKIGFNALDVKNEEQWKMAGTDCNLTGPSYGPYTFSASGFLRANRLLKVCISKKNVTIFLDEVGPLELSKHEGFYPVLSLFNSLSPDRHAYIIIRPELIEQFSREIIPDQNYEILNITIENRDRIDYQCQRTIFRP